MNVLVTLNEGIGIDLGPDFLVTTDVEGWSDVVNISLLLTGIEVTVPDGATVIYIQSLGLCLNILTLLIQETITTTTTTNGEETTTTTTTFFTCDNLNYTVDFVGTTTTTTTTML